MSEAAILQDKNRVLRAALDKAERAIAGHVQSERRLSEQIAAMKADALGAQATALNDIRITARKAALREAADLAVKAKTGMEARKAIMDLYFKDTPDATA